MNKWLQIFVLFGFLSFISMPTIFSFFDESTPNVVLFEEEEEQHNKQNILSNILPVSSVIITNLLSFNQILLNGFKFKFVDLKDNLSILVPTPPPDFI